MTTEPSDLVADLREKAAKQRAGHLYEPVHLPDGFRYTEERAADEIERLYSLAKANNALARRHADELTRLRTQVDAMAGALEETERLNAKGINHCTQRELDNVETLRRQALSTYRKTPNDVG